MNELTELIGHSILVDHVEGNISFIFLFFSLRRVSRCYFSLSCLIISEENEAKEILRIISRQRLARASSFKCIEMIGLAKKSKFLPGFCLCVCFSSAQKSPNNMADNSIQSLSRCTLVNSIASNISGRKSHTKTTTTMTTFLLLPSEDSWEHFMHEFNVIKGGDYSLAYRDESFQLLSLSFEEISIILFIPSF